MKLTVKQENLARGLQVVSRAVASRSTLPVLGNILLRTGEGGLKLTATNLEIGVVCWVPGKVDEDGTTTVPAKLLTDIVTSLPAGENVELDLGPQERLHLVCGRFETHLNGIDPDEFPAIPSAGERPTTQLTQRELRRALEEVAFAAATDEARPILTGVLTKFEGDKLTLAAADNYRIAIKTLTLAVPVEERTVVVPARSYHELARILTESDEMVDVILAPARNQILFHLDGIDLVSRLIDGQYPNYQQVLPQSHATRMVVERDELLKAVKLAALIANASANIVKLEVGGADGDVTITAAAEIGDHHGVVDASVEGNPTTIAFNAKYLTEVLQNVDAEQFAVELNGPLSPGVLRPIGDPGYLHVVMPVRTTS